jgi:dihydroorotate dehydrogenase electron transfer subunit
VSLDREFREPMPGQFVMIRFPWGPALARAFSPIAVGSGWMDLFVKTDGLLREAMAKAPRGSLLQIRGPYGVPFAERVDLRRRYVLVGGGSGIAPLVRFAESYPGSVAALAMGFRSGAVRPLVPGIDIAAEGENGETASDRLRAAWREGCGVIACGPEPLLASVAHRHRANAHAYVSLETRLGCGFGACRGCSIPTSSGMKRVCTDGPLFACSEVPWLG